MASPEQRLTADTVRGYNKEFLAQKCSCNCPRVSHANRSGRCASCDCPKFSLAEQPVRVATTVQELRDKYCLGTVGGGAPVPTSQQSHANAEEEELPEEWSQIILQARERDAAAVAASPPPAPREVVSSSRCPFCHADDFESVPSVKCPSCKAWAHVECVRELRKCAACLSDWPV